MKQHDNFKLELVTNVESGLYSINKVFPFLEEKNYKKILLFLDENLFRNSKYLKNFIKKLKIKKKPKVVFFDGKEEPTYQKLDTTIKYLKKSNPNIFDCIIAIGGGSTIDFSKGVATILKNPGTSIKYRGFPKKLNPSIPVIAIPSTAGTGAELAYNAVFTDMKSKIKFGINTKNNYPILSILDPKILINSPKSVIFNSGLGALIRSVDTLFNKKANKISEIFSLNAFSLLFSTLPKFLNNRKNLEYSSKMQWEAYLSVAALLNSSSGPSGEIAYYLSTNYKVPQGIGYGISGLNFFKTNHEKGYYEYSKLYELIKRNNDKKKLSNKEKSKYVINSLFKILKRSKKSMKKINISEEEIKKISGLVEKGNILKNISNNPVKLTKKDLIKIIKGIVK